MAEYDGKRLIFDSAAKVYRNDYRNYFAEKAVRPARFLPQVRLSADRIQDRYGDCK